MKHSRTQEIWENKETQETWENNETQKNTGDMGEQ